MYALGKCYGYKAYRAWEATKPTSLTDAKSSRDEANEDLWVVHSYSQLLEAIAFLGAMNKRLTLFFRGQASAQEPKPTLFRTGGWDFLNTRSFQISPRNRDRYWERLPEVGKRVYEICKSAAFGLPRWRGLRDVREIQWAVIQHYHVWPTPLIDLSGSLRAAATFAMAFRGGTPKVPQRGFLYVAGMPYSTGSIAYDLDQNLVLARLQSACPPVARRPHYQEGFLAGRFPFGRPDEETEKGSSLRRRIVAKFQLVDDGPFWDADFPLMREHSLMPARDDLQEAFISAFGNGPDSLAALAERISDQA
jgi:hypothetical protein